jgi:hypothetical protein
MARPSIEKGFKVWRDEVEALSRPEKTETVYLPVVALVGVFATFNTDPVRLTSYDWRQAVLANDDALAGYRLSLTNLFRDELNDTYELPIESFRPDESDALQHKNAYDSIIDGLPEGFTTIPSNEYFMARSLGFARHDHAVGLGPLRLWAYGPDCMQNNYPVTWGFIREYA